LGAVKREKFRNTNLVEGNKEQHQISMTPGCIAALPEDAVPITPKPAIRAQTLHFLTTHFCKILYVLVLFMPLIFSFPTCLLQLCVCPPFQILGFPTCLPQQALYAVVYLPTLPVSHHEYPYAKALVAYPAY
jgi:hypothetical protein